MEKKLVITVADQKDICSQGRTYPVKASAINKIKMARPENQEVKIQKMAVKGEPLVPK